MTKQRTREEWETLLHQSPLDLLLSVASRRRHVVSPGGRNPVLKPCLKCGESFPAREIRTHVRQCGVHLVPCKYCGKKANVRGTQLHEAQCLKNPERTIRKAAH